ncbi:MAG TPA: hypothetical protein VHW71_06370 [Steroidobacteraceae bacterium]|jgi:hypothetical protein|nr:hypothetical protein [Steroidobacteraceae bacterium]
MKIYLLALTLTSLAACAGRTEANRDSFTRAVNGYLDKRGDLCLGKYDWPIDVSAQEIQAGGRNAVQLPVLEKLGIVRSTTVSADEHANRDAAPLVVRRYELTETGKKYYLTRAGGGPHEHPADFCAAKLSLDKIVSWEVHQNGARSEALVTYTYRVDAAPWAKDADAQRVFPAVARVLSGAGKAQLREAFTRTGHGWAAKDSLD